MGVCSVSIQLRSDDTGQFLNGIRLFDVGPRTQALHFRDTAGFRIATGDNDFLIRVVFENPPIGFQSIDSRFHDHVQNHQITIMVAQICHRLLTAADGSWRISQMGQYFTGDIKLLRDIVYDQNLFSIAAKVFQGGSRFQAQFFPSVTGRYRVKRVPLPIPVSTLM